MTAGPTTALPKCGDIFHYAYLFGHNLDGGRDDGVKEHLVMVAAVDGPTVFTIAITSEGEGCGLSMKFPDEVAHKAGLGRVRRA